MRTPINRRIRLVGVLRMQTEQDDSDRFPVTNEQREIQRTSAEWRVV